MRTHELAHRLLANPDVEVVLQRDEEGNGYKPMRGADFDIVYLESEHEVYDRKWTADEADMDEDEWADLKKNAPLAVVFYP